MLVCFCWVSNAMSLFCCNELSFGVTCRPMKIGLVMAVVALAGWHVSSFAQAEIRQDAAYYFRTEGYYLPVLSPDGNYTFTRYRKPNGLHALVLADLRSGEVKPFGFGPSEHVGDARWLDSDSLLISFRDTVTLDAYGMFNLRREDLKLTLLTNYVSGILGIPSARPTNAWIYYADLSVPLIEIDGLGRTNAGGIGKDRNMIRMLRTPSNVSGFLTQANGEVRFCYTRRSPKDRPTLHWRPDPATDQWEVVPFEWDNHEYLGVDATGRGLFYSSYEGDPTKGLYRLDAESGARSESLYRDDDYSLDRASLLYSLGAGTVKGLRYTAENLKTVWFDRNFKGLQAYLDSQLPDGNNTIVGWNFAESIFLVLATASNRPDRLFRLDLQSKRLSDLTAKVPWQPRPTHFHTERLPFSSREGSKLRAYITKPAAPPPEKGFPLVVLMEESVWNQDSLEFDRRAQWLAANGYATLRVNSRNAEGQIRSLSADLRFDFAGGGRDHVEAVRAAIADPSIDRTRIGIFASGFGGYQALVALADSPALFKSALIHNGLFKVEEDFNATLKTSDPVEYEKVVALIEDSPDRALDYFGMPDEGVLRQIEAKVTMVVGRSLPPGAQKQFWRADSRFESNALFLQRTLRRVDREPALVRLELVPLADDPVPLEMTELGKLLQKSL